MSIAWKNSKGEVMHSVSSKPVYGNFGWHSIEMKAKAPAGAAYAWLLLKLEGVGKVWFRSPQFFEVTIKKNLLPANITFSKNENPKEYFFTPWKGKEFIKCGADDQVLLLEAGVGKPNPRGFKHWSAAAYDWSLFSAEYLGDCIERFSRLVKERDPDWLTVGYLSYAFAFGVEWDYSEHNAMWLDLILPRSMS